MNTRNSASRSQATYFATISPQTEEQPVRHWWTRWWYALSAPYEVPAIISVAAQEHGQRKKLTSVVLLITIAILIFPLIGATFTGNIRLLSQILLVAGINLIALFFNHIGKSYIAGIIAIAVAYLGTALSILIQPGGIEPSRMSLFDLLVHTVILAAALLPPGWIFLVAGANIVFTWAMLTFVEHAPEMDTLMSVRGYTIMSVPVMLNILIAVVAYLGIRFMVQTLRRANQAELIASLAQELVRQGDDMRIKQQRLDQSIQQIIEVHRRAANGDYSVRVPLCHENVLWQIAGPLNNLLARQQRMQYSEQQLYNTNTAISQLIQVLHQVDKGHPFAWNGSGTALDCLVATLSAVFIHQHEQQRPPPQVLYPPIPPGTRQTTGHIPRIILPQEFQQEKG